MDYTYCTVCGLRTHDGADAHEDCHRASVTLRREDLEGLDWTVQSHGNYAALMASANVVAQLLPCEEAPGAAKLMAAAPALALAAIEARRVFGLQAEDGDRGERASLEPVLARLDAALAQAGVSL